MRFVMRPLSLAVVLPVAMLAACEFSPSSDSATGSVATTDAENAIRAAAAAFSDAFEAGDTLSLGNLYTTNALLLAPSDTVRGRAAIRRWFRPRQGGSRFDHQLISDDLEVHGDVAVDRGRWIQKFERDGGRVDRASGVYLVIWRREADGRWRMAYDMWHAPYD